MNREEQLGTLLRPQSFEYQLPPLWCERPHQAEYQLIGSLGRGAQGVGERQGGHPTVATLGIGALAVEIRDIIAQSVGLGNAAPLATHFAINPHCPLCYPNQQPILPRQTLSPTIRPITPTSSGPITISGPATAPRTTAQNRRGRWQAQAARHPLLE